MIKDGSVAKRSKTKNRKKGKEQAIKTKDLIHQIYSTN